MAINSAIPVIVTGTGWTWTAIFGAAQTAIALVLGGGGFVAIVKVWPRMKELAIGQRRSDLDDMRDRIGELEKKVEVASASAHAAEMKLVYAVSAVQLLAAKVRADNPDDPTLAQAMELIAAATGGEMPSWAGKLAKGLSSTKAAA